MLPSLLAREVQNGLKSYLSTGFEPSDPLFAGIMKRFTEDESRWMRGPYVQLGLPFRIGTKGKTFFCSFETEFPGYVHQEAAWTRLSGASTVSTLVATGTGSGKTECFLYPVLDHCSRAATEGTPGIKALVIYPMNALATDQARRFAQVISQTPAFKGLRVGLFVGGNGGDGHGEPVMTPTSVITDRETMRTDPPDILLTNYKMLDYLLIRPRDSKLWAKNEPATLRYVVVDELHTFDGAQGTDLALLLRRLKARLKTPPGYLICVGTSATLGGNSDPTELCRYAAQVFSETFSFDSVVSENRLSETEFLGESAIEYVFFARPDLEQALDADQYGSQKSVVKAWFGLFFPDLAQPMDVDDLAWRVALGGLLKKHLLFVNLLKILKGRIISLDELKQQMQGPLPESVRPNISMILDALLVLVAWARDPKGQPFVTLKIHLWMRELRRMVALVDGDKQKIELCADSDIKREEGKLFLPLLQCVDCKTTGWLSRISVGQTQISTALDEIYSTWFSSQPEIVRLYAASGLPQPLCDGVKQRLCTHCGNLQIGAGDCSECRNKDLVDVFRVTATQTSNSKGGVAHVWHDPICPACGSKYRPILLGARIATLGSVSIEQSWASPFNDDKKLIAFSDSVQDAAHRAGFFTARTYLNTVRTGLSKVIDLVAKPQCPLPVFLDCCKDMWLDHASPLHMLPDQFVSEFIGPNMMWERDWATDLQELGTLKKGSKLPGRVQKRLAWQAFAEFTYLSRRGRTLDAIGKATVAPCIADISRAAEIVLPVLVEEFGIRHLDLPTVIHWLWGIVCHLRHRGAIALPELMNYAKTANLYAFLFSGGRKEWLPGMGEHSPHPVFLSLGTEAGYDHLVSPRSTTFYQTWLVAVLGAGGLLPQKAEAEIYGSAIDTLVQEGILLRIQGDSGDVIGLVPESLVLETELSRLVSKYGKRELVVPAGASDVLLGMPCLDAPQERYSTKTDAGTWFADRFSRGELRRVYSAEHTGLLGREQREKLEIRFKDKNPQPWFENLLSATPTLEMGVDIGDLSSVMLCSVPPNQASYLQRAGRAGRRDGNAFVITLTDGSNPHDLYFFEDTNEMLQGPVVPPGIFLKAAEVLRRQMFAFCMDKWVSSGIAETAFPKKTKDALDARDSLDKTKFPYTFLDFVLAHDTEFLADFENILGSDLDERVSARLKAFMLGTTEDDALRIRLNKVLEELAKERLVHKDQAEQIKKQIKAIRSAPQDEATRNEVERLERERQKKLEIIKEINGRDLLNTLTDAGLIPNYAFPEAGVELKSLLWRRKGSDDPDDSGAYIPLPAERYERPAQSALSEFAPENVFYANQRKVEIDQINMGLSTLEKWRMCPTCEHMENLELYADSHSSCPHCSDSMWANVSQERLLLRFKQAIANSNDADVRIDDSSEDREPILFLRQMLVDFEIQDIKEAFRLKVPDMPFGFEFIQRVVFRDVNFGEPSKAGEVYSVGGQKRLRPGFKLCKHCGKVQRPPRTAHEKEHAQLHAFDCEKRDSADPDNLIQCLYLYREFSSEALRILMPYTPSGVDETSIQSFMAALRIGLKAQFGGRVDHLRMITQEEKAAHGGAPRHYVMLYDSVPGGTGYLHELLANDARALIHVFRLSLGRLSSCSCNTDSEKDGCYRCVYQSRLGRAMALVSRDRARSILEDLVERLDQLERVKSIAEIFINPNFDSELEARFIESMPRLSGQGGLPLVKIVQEIVQGKSGYLLEVGDQRYWVEPQVDLGTKDGVAECSRPDFVLWPCQSLSKRRAIAVFCDGWTYHQESSRDDARKRSALVASGKFWVWSVTWEDVRAAMDGKTDTALTDGLSAMWFNHKDSIPPQFQTALNDALWARHSLAHLLHFLSGPSESESDPQSERLGRHAGATAFLMVPNPTDASLAPARAKLAEFWTKTQELSIERPQPGVACGNINDASLSIRYWWPMNLANPNKPLPVSPGFVVYNPTGLQTEPERHSIWRRWLWLFNIFQMLPGFLLATQDGLDSGDYCSLSFAPQTLPPFNAQGATQAAAWEDVISHAMESLSPGLTTLMKDGAIPPDEVGLELEDEGSVVAEAELAWLHARIVLLMPEHTYCLTIWQAKGWKPFIAENDWPNVVADELQLSKDKEVALQEIHA